MAVHHHAARRGAAAAGGQTGRGGAVHGDGASGRRRARGRLVLLQQHAGGRRDDAARRVGRREAVDGERRRATGHQGQLRRRERVLVQATFREPKKESIEISYLVRSVESDDRWGRIHRVWTRGRV